MFYTRMFLTATSTTSSSVLREQAGVHTARTCLNTCVLALGVLMAGSGHLTVLALCRRLRARTAAASSTHATGAAKAANSQQALLQQYHQSTYMCAHMAAGMLFMGGGR